MAFNWLRRGVTGAVDYKPETQHLDTSRSDYERDLSGQSRDEQGQLGQFYQNAMAGKGPSVAEKQMYAGRDEAIKASLAASAAGRGTNQAIAQRNAGQQTAAIAQQTNRDAGMLRAQEQMGYAQQYANLLQAKRLQDLQARGYSIDEAKAQLAYEGQLQGIKMQGSVAETQGNQKSIAGIIGAAGGAVAALSDENAKQNVTPIGASPPIRAAGGMDMVQMQPPQEMSFGQKLATALGGAGQGYAAGVNGDTNQLQALRNKQKDENAQNSQMFKYESEMPKEQPGLLGSVLGGALSGYAQGMQGSDIGMKQNLVPSDARTKNLGKALQAKRSDIEVHIAPDIQTFINEPSLAPGFEPGSPRMDNNLDRGSTPDDYRLGSRRVMSDEKAKKVSALTSALSATKAERYPVTEQFSQLPGYSYEYKAPYAEVYGAGKKVGPVAQDMEHIPAVANTVQVGPDGMRRVDTGQLTLTNTTAISETNRRLKELEAQKDAEIADLRRLLPGKKSISGSKDSGEAAITTVEDRKTPALGHAMKKGEQLSFRRFKGDADVSQGNPGFKQYIEEGKQYPSNPGALQALYGEEHMGLPVGVVASGNPSASDILTERQTMKEQAAGDAAATAVTNKKRGLKALANALAGGDQSGTSLGGVSQSGYNPRMVNPQRLVDEAKARGVKGVTLKDAKRALQDEYDL